MTRAVVASALLGAACGPLTPVELPEESPDPAVMASPATVVPEIARLEPRGDLEVWRGLRVAPPDRCSPFAPSDYSVAADWPLPRLVSPGEAFYELLTCRPFRMEADTLLARVVPAEDAHDTGLCGRPRAQRSAFAADPANWFYGDPVVLRLARRGRGAAHWLPTRNACWYAQTVLALRQRYDLTVSPAEVAALEPVLARCGAPVRAPSCAPPGPGDLR